MVFNDDFLREVACVAVEIEMRSIPTLDEIKLLPSVANDEIKDKLSLQLQSGILRPDAVAMGWRYYVKRTAAVLIIGTTLTSLIAPNQVMAACQKIVEVIQTVYREYTQLDYYSHAESSTEWKPLQITYLPQNMSKVPEESVEKRNATYSVYKADEKYFIIEQIMITEQSNRTENIDTENAIINRINRQGDTVLLISKNGMIQFVWMHGNYEIRGKTTLDEDELIRILNGIVL